MAISRRELIEKAFLAALAAASPASLLEAGERALPPEDRFLLISLKDGRSLAIDRLDERRVFLLTGHAAADGSYPLARAGVVEVRNGIAQTHAGVLEGDRAFETRAPDKLAVPPSPAGGPSATGVVPPASSIRLRTPHR